MFSSPRPERYRHLFLAILLALICLAFFLRFFMLPHESLGGDEMFSRRIALEPFARAWYDIRQDLVHPPLYYIVLKTVISALGTSPLGLRAFSLFAGLATIPFVAYLGTQLPNARWCGLLAGAMIAVGRNDIYYSQEARSYAFYTALVILLAIWFASFTHQKGDAGRWWIGFVLMSAIVYTHYVGGVYIALLVLAGFLFPPHRISSKRLLLCGLGALLLFLPWLLPELSVLHAKHGVSSNLDWQGRPSFYDLRQVWASSIGVLDLPGATMFALLIVFTLSGTALVISIRRFGRRESATVIAIACLGWLPPLLMFVLGQPPFNLPLFGLRHVLASTVFLALLCCYGLEQVALTCGGRYRNASMIGAAFLILLSAFPSIQSMARGPSRYPYDKIARVVAEAEQHGTTSFTTWYYAEGEPVNYYCGHVCVHPVPFDTSTLPTHLVLLYRPAVPVEKSAYAGLLGEGYVESRHLYFTDGDRKPFGTMVVDLKRAASH